ncbi:MAG: hypothetical protein ACLPKB_14385 [Xanthobacteraceae bacterium]
MSEEVRGSAIAYAASNGAANQQAPHVDAPSDSGEARAQRAGLEALEREFKDLLQHR